MAIVMNDIDRRRFLGTAAGAAAAFGANNVLRAEVAQPKAPADATAAKSTITSKPPAPPMIELGKTGVKMSRLGQGTGVHGGERQSDQTRMGFEKLVGLMRDSLLRPGRSLRHARLFSRSAAAHGSR
jgi:hypothetical protein